MTELDYVQVHVYRPHTMNSQPTDSTRSDKGLNVETYTAHATCFDIDNQSAQKVT